MQASSRRYRTVDSEERSARTEVWVGMSGFCTDTKLAVRICIFKIFWTNELKDLDTDQETWSVRFPHDKKFLKLLIYLWICFRNDPYYVFGWERLYQYMSGFFFFSFHWEEGIHILNRGFLCNKTNNTKIVRFSLNMFQKQTILLV